MLKPGVRDEGVQPSEAGDCRFHDGAISLTGREVAVLDIDAVHLPPVGLEPLDDRSADAAAGAGDKRRPCHYR